ncbi:MAG: hypothetical protein JST21_12165 [Bacteroidetes bacterium]|nr:hypothetical protein [Bacteroidota bacterium]
MKSKFQTGLVAILLLIAVSCSKDSSNSSTNVANNRQSNSVSGSTTSNAFAATMDDASSTVLSIPGQWVVYYDWDCDGGPGASVFTFNANGTWSSDEGYTGLWVTERHMLMFTFDNSETTYSGVIFSQQIKGIQATFAYAGALQGCFNMAPYSGSLTNKHKDGSTDASGKGR